MPSVCKYNDGGIRSSNFKKTSFNLEMEIYKNEHTLTRNRTQFSPIWFQFVKLIKIVDYNHSLSVIPKPSCFVDSVPYGR